MKATIVISQDSSNAYWLIIDRATGNGIAEIEFYRFDDDYNEEAIAKKEAAERGITEFNIIHF